MPRSPSPKRKCAAAVVVDLDDEVPVVARCSRAGRSASRPSGLRRLRRSPARYSLSVSPGSARRGSWSDRARGGRMQRVSGSRNVSGALAARDETARGSRCSRLIEPSHAHSPTVSLVPDGPQRLVRPCAPWSTSTTLPSRDAHVVNPAAVGRRQPGRQTERERQRVLRRPLDLEHRLVSSSPSTSGVDVGEPHGVARGGVGVRGIAGRRAEHLLEDQDVAGLQGEDARGAVAAAVPIACVSASGGGDSPSSSTRLRPRRAASRGSRLRQTTFVVAPGVEGESCCEPRGT